MPTVHLHRDQILSISNALNSEAAHFDALAEDGRFPPSSKKIWREKAAENRELSERLIVALQGGQP